MSKKSIPIVAIVGRANVGKSSLFNALIGKREAIVADEPGTTRDSITAKAELGSGKQFWLVDTAGMKPAEDKFELTIQEQITEATDSADIILVTVDASSIIASEDRRVAKLAFRSGKKIILLVNKADKAKPEQVENFKKLGIKMLIPTSATQKIGFDDLEEALEEALPHATITESDNRIRVALLGRPNVGKSSLYNTLIKKQRAIVANVAGTTRDINRTTVKYMSREIELLDTAGIRRSGRIKRGVEHFSVLRSLRAIEESDICMLLIDANEISVALDQKIAGMVKEAGKGLVLVISKWDIVDPSKIPGLATGPPKHKKTFSNVNLFPPEKKDSVSLDNIAKESGALLEATEKKKNEFTRDQMAPRIQRSFQFVPWAPLVFTSSVSGKNVTKLFELTLEIMDRRAQRPTTRDLNNWLKKVTNRHPPAGLKNRQPKLRYMVQEEDNPIPAFKIFGSQTKFLHWSYKRHMDRMMRETWDYVGSPIQLWFIDRDTKSKKKLKNNGNRDRIIRKKRASTKISSPTTNS